MKIGNKDLADNVYIIAEFGVNHNNNLELAKEGIRQAALSGADAIKFQTYTADELVCKNTPKFWEHESAKGMDQHEAYEVLGGFPKEWYPELIKECEANNIEFLSTPFSIEAADYLNELGMKAFKVASSDLSYLPYLAHIAKFNKPIFLSTGASTIDEIREAIKTIQEAGNNQIVVMHCTLKYPTEDKNANLKTIEAFQSLFVTHFIGFSDHTLGTTAAPIAAALGARVIEKHFTLDKNLLTTADHWLSVDPPELKQIVESVRNAKDMIGACRTEVFPFEERARKYDKRSIVSKVFIKEGTVITEDMITYKRPGTGLWPHHIHLVVGSTASRNIPADVPITFSML